MQDRHVFPGQGSRRPSVDPGLERWLRLMVSTGVVLVVALPAARGHSTWFGALPLWLVGMPLASWWALHRFRLPRRAGDGAAGPARRRKGGAQARRRAPARCRRQGIPRAA